MIGGGGCNQQVFNIRAARLFSIISVTQQSVYLMKLFEDVARMWVLELGGIKLLGDDSVCQAAR